MRSETKSEEPDKPLDPQEQRLSEVQLLERAVRNIRGIEGNLDALDRIKDEFERRRQEIERERDKLLRAQNRNGEERQAG